MAADGENIDESQTTEPGASDVSAAGSDVISLDDIDSILEEEAPEFAEDMNDLAGSGDDFDDGDLGETGVEVELPKDGIKERGNKFLKKITSIPMVSFLLRLIARLKVTVRIVAGNITSLFKALGRTLLSFAKAAPRVSAEYLKYQISHFSKETKELGRQFKAKSKGEKILIGLFVIMTVVTGVVIYRTIRSDWMTSDQPLLISSLEQVASRGWTYKLKTETTPFLMAFPQPKHSYLFRKIVVNLQQRVSSLSGAMGAFEFYVEVDSKDAASELKGRETMFRDMIQRVAEQYKFETLQTENGKKRLKEDLKSEINKELAQGWVKEVFIKFMVTKQ